MCSSSDWHQVAGMSAIVKTVTRPRKLIFAPTETKDAPRKQSDKSVKSYTDEESK